LETSGRVFYTVIIFFCHAFEETIPENKRADEEEGEGKELEDHFLLVVYNF